MDRAVDMRGNELRWFDRAGLSGFQRATVPTRRYSRVSNPRSVSREPVTIEDGLPGSNSHIDRFCGRHGRMATNNLVSSHLTFPLSFTRSNLSLSALEELPLTSSSLAESTSLSRARASASLLAIRHSVLALLEVSSWMLRGLSAVSVSSMR